MIPFNFNHFYYFYEIARHGSFTAAAGELMVSQSSLSIQIKQFEKELGGPLFDRRKGGVDLTEKGVVAYQVADRVFHEIDRLQSSLMETERRIRGMLSVGTVNSIGVYVLPQILTAFKARFPEVQIKIDFKGAEKVLDMLYSGKLDFAIIPWNRRYPDLTGVKITHNKLFLVAPADHPLAGKPSVSPRDLEAFPFVGYEDGMQTRSMIDSLFKRMSVSVEYSIESANTATIKHMVMAGMGLGFLPDNAVASEIRRGQLKRLDIPALMMTRDIVLYYRTNRTLTRTREEFVQFLVDYFKPRKRRR
ncbi:MAG: LysR family transcriptional regulator [Candidatus Latescibacterota bacterium]|jgi:DNA-binding transcriptional LysR family regulator